MIGTGPNPLDGDVYCHLSSFTFFFVWNQLHSFVGRRLRSTDAIRYRRIVLLTYWFLQVSCLFLLKFFLPHMPHADGAQFRSYRYFLSIFSDFIGFRMHPRMWNIQRKTNPPYFRTLYPLPKGRVLRNRREIFGESPRDPKVDSSSIHVFNVSNRILVRWWLSVFRQWNLSLSLVCPSQQPDRYFVP